MKKLIFILIAVGFATTLFAQENASNPLAAVNNTDIRYEHFDLGDGASLNDLWVDGAYMLTPKLKLKYELHYWNSDVTGTSLSDFQSFHIKAIYFPLQGKWGSWKYRMALGLEWIVGLANEEIPIQVRGKPYSDQLSPFVGLAFVKGGTVLVPLVQQFKSYNGPPVNTTATRLIAIQSLPNAFWGKLDLIVPFDWENDTVPAEANVQLGRMFSPSFGLYIDGYVGIIDKPYIWGAGVGCRFNY